MLTAKREEVDDQLVQDPKTKKRLVNLNKNVMSVVLPYLHHDEILKVEGCSKQMAVFAGFWPVWKNIYTDWHKKDERIPAHEKDMTEEERESHDYRAACKRCFLYLKRNLADEEDDMEPALADYHKGEAFIVLEEFLLSLSKHCIQ